MERNRSLEACSKRTDFVPIPFIMLCLLAAIRVQYSFITSFCCDELAFQKGEKQEYQVTMD